MAQLPPNPDTTQDQALPAPPADPRPPHTQTQSTLAPTSEFTRIFLLAMVARYVFRGFWGEVFHPRTFDWLKRPMNRFLDWSVTNKMTKTITHTLNEDTALVGRLQHNLKGLTLEGTGEAGVFYRKLRPIIRRWRGNASDEIPSIVGKAIFKDGKFALHHDSVGQLRNLPRAGMYAIAYNLSLGIGSAALTLRYSAMVRNDIHHIFRETVAYEKGVPQEQVTFNDIKHSDNVIIQHTVQNYRSKFWQRLATDSLFFIFAPFKSLSLGDLALGIKGTQLFAETWKRKTTIFEDITAFINNKINPRNGLGQPITTGEVFDLYQHYADNFAPDKLFRNAVIPDAAEGQVWAKSEPVFKRITELLNHTYAYKHNVAINDIGKPDADFALPKFIYLLGHGLIQPRQPEQTLLTIEVANQYGIPAVKEMQSMLGKGASLGQVAQRFPITPIQWAAEKPAQEPNRLLQKGAGVQLAQAEIPGRKISAGSTSESVLAPAAAQLAAT